MGLEVGKTWPISAHISTLYRLSTDLLDRTLTNPILGLSAILYLLVVTSIHQLLAKTEGKSTGQCELELTLCTAAVFQESPTAHLYVTMARRASKQLVYRENLDSNTGPDMFSNSSTN